MEGSIVQYMGRVDQYKIVWSGKAIFNTCNTL